MTSGPRSTAAERLHTVAAEAAGCTACDLHARATQVVFGEGTAEARLLLVGEQPGDQEDRQGHPFVGPAGRVLDEALDAAGITRADVYVTNAVKHFKWQPRGKRRIHQSPNRTEIVACRPWLVQELAIVEPDVVVSLGATAGKALWGGTFRVGEADGQVLELEGRPAVATIHPSAVLRAQTADDRADLHDKLVADLRRADRLVRAS